jgi:sugar lactone lactonase YvrE
MPQSAEADVAVLTGARPVTAVRAHLGEGARWDAGRSELLWVDILAGRLHRCTVSATADLHPVASVDVGATLGAVAPVDGDGWLLAAGQGVALLDNEGTLTQLRQVTEHGRTNDAACDPQGRFWVGTIGPQAAPGAGVLARLDRDGTVTTVLDGLTISNGIGWSADSTTMYLVDSGPGTLTAFSFDPVAGTLSHPRVLVDAQPGEGVPDGLTVDASGDLWVAMFDGWEARRYSPTGVLTARIPLPVPQVTSVCVGGPLLDTLFVTTATEGWSDAQRAGRPDAGAVFALRAPARGRPASAFRPVGPWWPGTRA